MPDTKHLEFLQAAITRMGGNAFLAKGWGITLVTAALGVAIKGGTPAIALVAIVPALMFWLLDAYYLALEQGLRSLYDRAAATYRSGGDADFVMKPEDPMPRLPAMMWRPAVVMVHLPLVLLLVLASIWLHRYGPPPVAK